MMQYSKAGVITEREARQLEQALQDTRSGEISAFKVMMQTDSDIQKEMKRDPLGRDAGVTLTWFLCLMCKPIHIVMNDEWASRHRPLTFTLPADAALHGTANSIKQGRTAEGYFLASDVDFSPGGIRFVLTGGELSFVPEDWEQAWQASFTSQRTFNWADVTDDWLAFMFGYRVFDGTRGREKGRESKDYLVNTVHGLRYLHEQVEGEELTVPGAIEQVIEALAEGKDDSHFPDDTPLSWPKKWKSSGALLKAVNNDRKEAAEIKGWTIKRGRPKGKKTDE